MSRLKNFPNKVSVGMKSSGELVLLPEKADWGIFSKEQIRNVKMYALLPIYTEVALKRGGKKKKPSEKSKPIEQKPEDNEGGAEPMFHCNACDRDVDNPKTAANGKAQCPNCLIIGRIVGKE